MAPRHYLPDTPGLGIAWGQMTSGIQTSVGWSSLCHSNFVFYDRYDTRSNTTLRSSHLWSHPSVDDRGEFLYGFERSRFRENQAPQNLRLWIATTLGSSKPRWKVIDPVLSWATSALILPSINLNTSTLLRPYRLIQNKNNWACRDTIEISTAHETKILLIWLMTWSSLFFFSPLSLLSPTFDPESCFTCRTRHRAFSF